MGFTSFCQDEPTPLELSQVAEKVSIERDSFADAFKIRDDNSPSKESIKKREGKESGKKSALYLKIMREHNLLAQENKIEYQVPSLMKAPTKFAEQTQEKQPSVWQQKKPTEQKPFEFQTGNRAVDKVSNDSKRQEYEPLSLQLKKNFQLRSSEPIQESGPRKLTRP